MAKSVVIVHGLFMSSKIMMKVESNFKSLGYKTYNFNYRSTRFSKKTTDQFHDFCKKIPGDQLYFYGHSLGGLLIFKYLNCYQTNFKNIKVVTIGSPVNGSNLAKIIIGNKFVRPMFKKINESNILLKSTVLLRPDVPVGSIIGTFNLGINGLLKEPGDGTVSIKEASANWVTDKVHVNYNHTALVYARIPVLCADHFFNNDKFSESNS